MKIHFQHTFIQGIFTKWAIVSFYDLDLQLYATLSDIRNNWHVRHVAMHEKQPKNNKRYQK